LKVHPDLKTVGIIGAGQLGQMLGVAAAQLGLDCVFLDPSENPPASSVGRVIAAAFDDRKALAALATACDVITYEFENVPVAAVRSIASGCAVFPPPQALEYAQDRLAEKRLFESLQIPVAGYRAIDSVNDLKQAAETLELPLVVKTRRLGYDGKGQAVLQHREDAERVFESLGGQDLIAEQFVQFDREVSAIGARGTDGRVVTYALSENEHHAGILRVSRAPAAGAQLRALADDYLDRLMTKLHYVGVLALELFVEGDRLLANEFAPRVHNSGHWTIEGARTSQFENHLRAITGTALADASTVGFPGMVNIIGTMPADLSVFEAANAVLHDYGKEARPGRKLGHVTIVASSIEDRNRRLLSLRDAL
jgi:5-(carboxyamino)imidazole ribonucleotide synthase